MFKPMPDQNALLRITSLVLAGCLPGLALPASTDGVAGQQHYADSFLGDDGHYHIQGAFPGSDGRYHPAGSVMGAHGRYVEPEAAAEKERQNKNGVDN